MLGIGRRTFAVAAGQYISIAAAKTMGAFFIEASPCLCGSVVDFQQELVHLFSPALTIFLPCPLQFAQVMGIAKGVQAGELKVRFPVIVAKNAPEVFEHPHGFHRLAAPPGMREEQGPSTVGNTMQPEAVALDVDAGFVGMQQHLGDQLPDDNRFEARQQVEGFLVDLPAGRQELNTEPALSGIPPWSQK